MNRSQLQNTQEVAGKKRNAMQMHVLKSSIRMIDNFYELTASTNNNPVLHKEFIPHFFNN